MHRRWQLGAYAVSQAVELGTEGGEHPAQHGEPVLDQSQLGPPLLGIYSEHGLQSLGRQVANETKTETGADASWRDAGPRETVGPTCC
jgi:hypothetical protein